MKAPQKRKRCRASGKIRFSTARAALAHAHNRRQNNNGSQFTGPEWTYRCPACGAIHLTSAPPRPGQEGAR